MPDNNFHRCIVNLPDQGLVIEGLLDGETMELRQGNQRILLPGGGERLQHVYDAMNLVNTASTKAKKTAQHYEKARKQIEEASCLNCDGSVQLQASKEVPS